MVTMVAVIVVMVMLIVVDIGMLTPLPTVLRTIPGPM